jgi:hypothetical protein
MNMNNFTVDTGLLGCNAVTEGVGSYVPLKVYVCQQVHMSLQPT